MASNTINFQGNFESNGLATTISFPSGITWMNTYNLSSMTSPTNGDCLQAKWLLGMASGSGIIYEYVSASTAMNPVFQAGGFTLIDTSAAVSGVINATVTAVSTASIPVVTNSGTNGLSAGQVVRLINIAGAPQLGGIDFTVGINTLSTTTFSLDYMAQLSVAGTTGSWMLINHDPIFYPRHRIITKITQASQAVVTLSVTHGYLVGQQVRMVVPVANGMSQMNGLQATIVAINTTNNTITINVDSTSFSAFAFPLAAGVPFTPAQVTPIGENTAFANSQGINSLNDATVNQAITGIVLAAGAGAPAGANTDTIFWEAGTTFSPNTIVPQ